MFRSVSWLQFFSSLFIGFLVYYGYFGLVYYRAGLLRFFRKEAIPTVPGTAASAEDMTAIEKASTAGQGKTVKRLETGRDTSGEENGGADPDNNATEANKGTKETAAAAKAASQLADMAIMHLKEVVDQSVASGEDWEEIKRRMELVLEGCRKLRGTEYEAPINSFIERNCRASFELVLGKEDLNRLWGLKQQEERLNGQQEKRADDQEEEKPNGHRVKIANEEKGQTTKTS